MHVSAVVEMTVIDIEFADQPFFLCVGNTDAEVFRHTGMGGAEVIRRAPIRGKNSGPILQQCEPARVIDMSLTAELMWHVGGFGPVRHQLN
jgi:hypothetical protein